MLVKQVLFFAFTIILLQNNFYSQAQDARIPKVIQPAPDAAALQKYGDIPIGAYTGTPNISIPLYELKAGDITLPISISYNAAGIKVAEEASRVGLGWSLNAGGAISRSIIGKDDWDSYHDQTTFEIPLGPNYDQGNGFNYWFNCLMSINGYSFSQNTQVTLNDQNSDFQPDQYSYNFNGHSGKFVLRRNKDVVLSKTEKIDIQLSNPTTAAGWTIKTPDGFLYTFEDIEFYIDYSTSRKSSWYLSKITSPSGRIVQFTYSDMVSNIQAAGSYFESRPIGFLASASCTPTLPSIYSNTISGPTYHSLYLSKISSDQGEVVFNYAPGRVDIANDVQLNTVQVFSKKYNEALPLLLKTWTFNYSYFIGTSMNGWSNPTNPELLYNRLKLTSIQESSGSVVLPPYTFSYNNDNTADPSLLPAKLSFARDHWGYFNGKFGNTSLIPSFVGGGGGTVNIGTMSNERNTDPVYSQLFVLNKIQYPTGGLTAFEYESNDFDESKSLSNDHSYFATFGSSIPTVLQASVPNLGAGGAFTNSLDLNNMYPSGQEVKIEAYFINYSTPITIAQANTINYSLFDQQGLQIGGGPVGLWLGSVTPPMTEWLGTSSANSGLKMTLLKNITPGIYTFKFDLPAGVALVANIVMNYNRSEGSSQIVNSGETVYNALFTGGLRVRRVTDYTNTTTVAKLRKYNYHYQVNGKAYSYGKQMAKPNYSYYELIPGTGCSRACLFRESDSNIPLNGGNGSNVGYDLVEELYGENGENGKIVYEYENKPDVILNFTAVLQEPFSATIPLKPPVGSTVPNATNGNLIAQYTYANIGGQFIKSSETKNVYQELSDFNHSVVYGIDKRVVADQNVPGMECGMLSFYIYPALTIRRSELTSTTSIKYDIKGNTSPIKTTSEFVYNNTSHLQVVSKSDYKSNGDKVTTTFTYPADYTDAQSDLAILLMKGAAYMHALPVTRLITTMKGSNNLITGGYINKYQVLNNKVFSKVEAVLEISQPVTYNPVLVAYNPASGSYPPACYPKVFYDSYDLSGNITEAHKSYDNSMTYIWDYFANYPVAEVSNATIATCAFTSFEADGKGNWTFSGIPSNNSTSFTGKRTYTLNGTNNITKSGLDASKLYTVSYWSKTASAIVNGTTATAVITRNGWTYYEHALPGNTTSIAISGSVIIDELRLFPKGALMTTYCFDPLVGMSSQCDANNRVTNYQYDELQRLQFIKDLEGNIIKTFEYKYKQ